MPLIEDDQQEQRNKSARVATGAHLPQGEGLYTVDEAVASLGVGWFQVLLMLVVGFCAVGEGANATVAAFVAPAVKCEWGLTDQQESLLTVWVFIGLLIGAYVWGAAADIAGRKVALLCATVGGILTSSLAAIMPNIGLLQFFFGLMGFTFAGQFSGMSYLLEYVPAGHRGGWGIIAGVFWSIGILGNALTAWGVMPWGGWRTLMVVTNIPYFIVLLLFPFVPESAYFLVAVGKTEKAMTALKQAARLNGAHLPAGQLFVPNPCIRGCSVSSVLYKDLYKDPSKRVRNFMVQSGRLLSKSLWLTTVLVMVLSVCVNVVYNIILLLTTQIHTSEKRTCLGKEFHFTDKDYQEVLIVSSADLIGNLLPVLLIDWIGRKWSMFTLSGSTALSLSPLLVAGSLLNPTWVLFVARALAASWSAVLSVYTPEVFPTEIRAVSTGIMRVFSALGSMPAGFVAQGLYDSCGIRASVGVLVGLTGIGMPAVASLPKDLTGKPLEDSGGEDLKASVLLGSTSSEGTDDIETAREGPL